MGRITEAHESIAQHNRAADVLGADLTPRVSLVKRNAAYAAMMLSPKGRTMRQFAIVSEFTAASILVTSTTPERIRFIRIG